MDNGKFGFGIIGCGAISYKHADAIMTIPGARLVSAVDTNGAARGNFSIKYNIPVSDSIESMLNDDAIDIVCICTPSGLHAQYAVLCANAGKNIILEKPMALNLAEADDIILACEKNHVKLTVISQLRFTPAIIKVKEAVEGGRLGKLIMGDIVMKYYRSREYYNNGGWRGTWKLDGGGALMNQGIHGIDLLLHVIGPVKSVYARAATLARDIEVEDTMAAVVEFVNGAMGVVQATTSIYPGSPRRLEINGSKGTIAMEENRLVKWQIEGQPQTVDLQSGDNEYDTSSDPMAFGIDGHVKQIADLMNAISSGRKPVVDQYEGRKAIKLIMAIYESAKTGKSVALAVMLLWSCSKEIILLMTMRHIHMKHMKAFVKK